MMDRKKIEAEARKAFAQRDRLQEQLRAVDNNLRTLRAAYMVESRLWGISNERFRQEVAKKVAA